MFTVPASPEIGSATMSARSAWSWVLKAGRYSGGVPALFEPALNVSL
jgi:hypothetical protein